MRDEHVSIGPSHLASRRDSAHLPIRGVFRLLDPLRKEPRRRLIATIRSLLPERLVRALFVVLLTKPVEAFLLAAPVGRWRRRGFLLERAMHAFVPSVLLRFTGGDALRHNAGLDPARRKSRQAALSVAYETGRSVLVGGAGWPL